MSRGWPTLWEPSKRQLRMGPRGLKEGDRVTVRRENGKRDKTYGVLDVQGPPDMRGDVPLREPNNGPRLTLHKCFLARARKG